MQRDAILQAARRDSKFLFVTSLIVFGFCAIVLVYNWTYVYNWILGPFTFDAALAAPNGPREFITVDASDLKATTVIEESTVRLFRGAVESTSVNANYFVADVGGKLLIVKLDPEFSGDTVEGRLKPLSNALRTKIEQRASSELSLHPAVLDAEQTSYGWDFNLFVLVAAPLSPLAVLLVVFAFWRRINVEHHPELGRLERHGTVRSVIARIESEFGALGEGARTGSLWISDDWVVALAPTLNIFATDELVAAGLRSSATKSGDTTHELLFWRRDSPFETTLETTMIQAAATIARLKEQFPWLVVEDVADFENRWRDEREACLVESDLRRKAGA